MPVSIGENRWYDDQFGTTPIHIGDSFATPVITYSTPYYVETVIEGASYNVGPSDNTFGGGNNFNNYQYLVFDVESQVILKTVRVFADGDGDRTVELRDANGSVLESTTVYMADGESVVTLNMSLPIGNDLQLGVSNNSNINLYRNNEGVSYPYSVNNLVNITRSSANQAGGLNHYYFFYDWVVGDIDCVSPRHEIIASTGVCIGIDEINANSVKIYPNPNLGSFTLSWENIDLNSINIYNAQGQLVERIISSLDGNNLELDLSSGIYHIQLEALEGVITKKVIVQ
jgi:hypothetical protein